MDDLTLPSPRSLAHTNPSKPTLNPPCAVFPDTLPALTPPALNILPAPGPPSPPLSPSTPTPQYDYFHWSQLPMTPPDLSYPAPVGAVSDDHPGHVDAATAGAWYAFARGLHTPVGAVLFPDHANRPTRRPRTSNIHDHVDPDISPSSSSSSSSPSSTSSTSTTDWDRRLTPCVVSSLRAPSNPSADVVSTPDDEITAEQAANGVDVQGIPWDTLPFSRADYRATRMSEQSRRDSTEYNEGLKYLLKEPRRGAQFYDFFKSSRRVKCSIVHFQLRNLAWATSKHDVYVMHDATVVHWDSVAKRKTQVLDLSGSETSLSSGLGMVQISTMIAKDDLVIAGGFYGEMVAKNMRTGTIIHDKRITYDENAITNAIDIFDNTIMTSNNDCYVRCFDMNTFQRKSSFSFNSPVNHATRQPDGKMVAVAGDDNPIQVIDGDSGERIAQLHGHGHYSFATGWHPHGRMFATGSQDKTCRVWDVRNMSQSFSVLGAHIGAVRSLRFSSCGEFMVMAEPRDFVHIFDVNGGEFNTCQEIDLFGEIAGIAITPCSEGFYVAVSDRLYSSLIEYERRDSSSLSDLFY